MDFKSFFFRGGRGAETPSPESRAEGVFSSGREEETELIRAEEISGHLRIRMERANSQRPGENIEKNGEGNITMLDANVLVPGIKIEVHFMQNIINRKGPTEVATLTYQKLFVEAVEKVRSEICISTIDSNRVSRKFYVQRLES